MRSSVWSHPTDEPGAGVDFPPVENGIDYLRDVVDRLAREDDLPVTPRGLKYAVLHLQAATEVLMKYRLSLEHWTLVLEKLDLTRTSKKPITPEGFDGGDFISCSLKETVLRLRNIVGVAITQDEEGQIVSLAKSRNALQHYGLTDSEGTIETRTAEVLDFLIRFLDEELLPQLDEEARERVVEDMEHIRRGLTKIQAYTDQRMERLRQNPLLTDAKERTLQCPDCRQWALVAGGPTKCFFCTAAVAPELAAESYAFSILRLPWRRPKPTNDPFTDPATPPVDACPECETDSLVRGAITVASQDRPTNFCFNCAVGFPDLCEICHRPFRPVDEQSICDSCLVPTDD
ncbi:hypothetical protein [[Kitasatospora] papulosa]|uniref:hypothetical protein n=1 Tax=[Kitasatospora] papulosa TaxID=1464011 RepID=UPI00368AD65A